MNKTIFQAGMRVLSEAWPDYPLKPGTVEAYRMALDDLHEATFQEAIAACLKECKFFPKPAEIRSRAAEVLDAHGLLPPSGEAAWHEVTTCNWHPDIPTSQKPFSHELIDQAVRAIGGMRRVFNTDLKELGFLRREFLDFYDHKREQEIRYGPALMGQALPALPEAVKEPAA